MWSSREDPPWIRLEDLSAVAAARRATTRLCTRLAFSEQRTAEVSLAATELATNAVLHASAPSLLVRVRRWLDTAGVDMVLMDRGPGMADVDASFEDGVSTRGTFGVGLGTVRRLSNGLDVLSSPASGTVTHAMFCPSIATTPPSISVDGLTRPITGEDANGDAWAARETDSALTMLVVDGLGHGELAAHAARAAIDMFASEPWRGPAAFLEAANGRLAGSRGAAVFAGHLERDTGRLVYSSVGNIAGRVVGHDHAVGLVSHPGIVGVLTRAVKEQSVIVEPGSVVVIHSDGLTQKWDVSTVRTARTRNPTLLGGLLLRDAGIHHDDATAVVARADR
jgi:anti-sigma regulatory factor (Ser/Thr protein kinase)